MGKGDFIIENAKRYKDINFIGIEKYDSVIVRAIQKLEGKNIPNLKLIRFDATNIEDGYITVVSEELTNGVTSMLENLWKISLTIG